MGLKTLHLTWLARCGVWTLGLLLPAWAASGSSPEAAGVEFFEKHVRPVLVEHCYECHSSEAKKVKGGLLLDTKEAVLKGGDSGPAIIPGEVEKSLLVKAVRYTDENLQMPPKNKKLSAEQIADLEAWVKMGAPDPRVAGGKQVAKSAREHWAFKPVKLPPAPAVKNSRWAQSPIDHFIVEKLEARGLAPNPPADKRTLIRRATYDLTGLPPSAQEVEEFANDKSAEAWPRVIERLLNSPHYGERWGRYWLDIARYADTKGYVFEEERRFPYSYTYRDYVIRSLNEDLPFDQFILHQLAADLLPLGDDKRPLAALGFLTLGRRFLNNQPDIIDDRIDVVTRGFMGLTVTCARCHDHKYDPIPTKDYYSLYGVFASCSEPGERPLLGKEALPREYPAYISEREKREKELKSYREEKQAEVRARLRARVGDYLLTAHEGMKLGDKGKQEALARERKLGPAVVQRWIESLAQWKSKGNAVFTPWFVYASLSETNFADEARGLKWTGSNSVNSVVVSAFSEPPKSLKGAAERYTAVFTNIDQQWKEFAKSAADKQSTASGPNASTPAALPDKDAEELRQILYADTSPLHLEGDEFNRLFDTPVSQKLRALRRKVDEVDATHAGAPPRAMALVDDPKPHNPRVFIRGNSRNHGAEVPRQFLEVLAGPDRKPFQKGSGRLELAEAIASPDNPLTARVVVNRVWMYHFGTPLVRTPSDFGLRSEPPTHPELLDYLAVRFVVDCWSLKKLHRAIMLSSVYQQSSDFNANSAREDLNNQLLWRMNRRRLDFEAMRDTFLRIAGAIDLSMGGRAVDLTTEPFTGRRTIYGFVERQNLPGLFRTFDFASPDTTSPQRFTTTVPQQALFLMNSPFVVQQTKRLVENPEVARAADEEQKIQQLYLACFQRKPDAAETALARDFLVAQSAATKAPAQPPAWQYGWGEFDVAAGRTTSFKLLAHFTSYAWQGGTNLPDPQLGWVLLTADGGHPGNDLQHAAIRRWTAPRDGIISIVGELHHPEDKGDGVRARIVSSRSGVAGEWTAFHRKTETRVDRLEVKRGDAIDFITDCRETVTNDSFNWSPQIDYLSSGQSPVAGEASTWNAKVDFAGPPKEKPKSLDPWQKFAQVLLLANETIFVD
ncbi:MAG: PSD1 and planctomycete cytochrome C domain-containing protein [Verrucomicrobia subdivision 3 bacterium]|nr:PSD1 and planctomycete cytochrome C domain-containing protein [Limisphaerales bacterium]